MGGQLIEVSQPYWQELGGGQASSQPLFFCKA